MRLIWLGFLLLTQSFVQVDAIREITFAQLEEEKGQKLVVFYDDGTESQQALTVLSQVQADGRLVAWEPVKVDAEASINEAKIKEAGFSKYPAVFTNSAEGGVEQWKGAFTKEAVDEWFSFKNLVVTSDRVKRFEKLSKPINKLAKAKKPVFLKLYEEWCPHCKAIKKDFQVASLKVPSWRWIEVECSKTADTKRFCQHIGASGYPTFAVLSNGEVMKYTGNRDLKSLINFTENFAAKRDQEDWKPFNNFVYEEPVKEKKKKSKGGGKVKGQGDDDEFDPADYKGTDVIEGLEEIETEIALGKRKPRDNKKEAMAGKKEKSEKTGNVGSANAEISALQKKVESMEGKLDKVLELLSGKINLKDEL